MSEPMPMWFCLQCGSVAMDWGSEDPIANLGTTITVDDKAVGFLCKACLSRAEATGRMHVADPSLN
jgi:hypothetical protein